MGLLGSRLVLITQVHRSGGTMFSQLLDGHSEIAAHPHELFIGKPEKWDWPSFSTAQLQAFSAVEIFDFLKEDKIARIGSLGQFIKPGSNEAAKNQYVPFNYSLQRHQSLFVDRWNESPAKSRHQAILLYLSTFFEAWPEYLSSGREKLLSCFLPHILMHDASMKRLIEDFPGLLLVNIVRRPDSWLSSLINHLKLDVDDHASLDQHLKRWKKSVKLIGAWQNLSCVDTFLTNYEGLVLDPQNELENFSHCAGIQFEPTLTLPTVGRFPVLPNSSYTSSTQGVNQSSLLPKIKFTGTVRKKLENDLLPFYFEFCSKYGLASSENLVISSHLTSESIVNKSSKKKDKAKDSWVPYSLQRLASSRASSEPFPFLVCPDFLPQELFHRIVEHYPAPDQMKKMPAERSGNQYAHLYRSMLSVNSDTLSSMSSDQRQAWIDFQTFIGKISFDLLKSLPLAPEGQRSLLPQEDQIKTRIDLWSDDGGYQITPHSDAPHKVATFLLYCTDDKALKDQGTSLFRPLDESFSCWSGRQYPFEQFKEVGRVNYQANQMFGFKKTCKSFHGKMPTEVFGSSRKTVALTIQLKDRFVS